MGSLKNKRILVTGGKGYLGSHLCEALKKENAKVFIADINSDNSKFEFKTDVRDRDGLCRIVSETKPEIIYHLAATLDRERDISLHEKVMDINLNGTVNLLHALKDTDYLNFIFTSTSEIYGNNKAPFNEKQIPFPASSYSLSKLFAEHSVRTYSGIMNKNHTILRLFNFFGESIAGNFFIPQLISSLKKKSVFKMTKGKQVRDFLYIDDVVKALLLAAEKKNSVNQTFNVCSGKGIMLKKLVEEFKKYIDGNCKIEFGSLPYRKNEIFDMRGNNKKVKDLLGFRPEYSLSKAIKKVATNLNHLQ